ncbi:hypothetical protein M011DRAFT_71822 [Sporormia fimetaria CBS 119925]|uniref:HTH psq-type domain-containing protein n=1 Tax=Sporormia fimetaria CBS 119925 TaxID=1340428 RepID=A0A6A6VCH4_9PLEO|nr:hypothetical protein M011DRAFT_71822 [Sporormia fimetaria CBS 119925]
MERINNDPQLFLPNPYKASDTSFSSCESFVELGFVHLHILSSESALLSASAYRAEECDFAAILLHGVLGNLVTYFTGELATRVSWPPLPRPHQNHNTITSNTMNSPTHAKSASNEAQIQLALQAMQKDASLTVRRAAKLYNVPRSTLSARRAGKAPRRDCRPTVTRLTVTEEEVIVRHILELDSRGFFPQARRCEGYGRFFAGCASL